MHKKLNLRPILRLAVKKSLFTLVLTIGFGGALATFTHSAAAPSGKHGGATDTSVAVATAAKADIPIIRQALGTVTPIANVTVRTQISGILEKVLFDEGQLVHQGDQIAEVDARPYEFALTQAQGTLLRDQALLKDAQTNLERYKKLVSQDSLSKQQLDTQAALVQQYEGIIKTDEGLIDTAKLNIEYCHITSPITGRVGLRAVDAGNYVQTGDTNGIVTITQLQPISVIFTLPEDDIPAIMKQHNAGQELTATAFDRMHTNQLAVGKLVAMGNQVDTTTGTVKYRAQFDNPDNLLFPNQFVNIDLLVDTLHDQITVPTAAIQRGTPGTYVYLVKDDKTVTVRPIKIGPDNGTVTSVTDGLAIGDRVVTDGLDHLREGATIKIHDDSKKDKDSKDKDGKHKGDAKDSKDSDNASAPATDGQSATTPASTKSDGVDPGKARNVNDGAPDQPNGQPPSSPQPSMSTPATTTDAPLISQPSSQSQSQSQSPSMSPPPPAP